MLRTISEPYPDAVSDRRFRAKRRKARRADRSFIVYGPHSSRARDDNNTGRRLPRLTDVFFANRGFAPGCGGGIRKAVDGRARKGRWRATEYRVHDPRHAAVTNLSSVGVSDVVGTSMSGHTHVHTDGPATPTDASIGAIRDKSPKLE